MVGLFYQVSAAAGMLDLILVIRSLSLSFCLPSSCCSSPSLLRCLQFLGSRHPTLVLPLVPELLSTHPYFDTPEPDMDDPACILFRQDSDRKEVSFFGAAFNFTTRIE